MRDMEKNSENLNQELRIINDRCTDLEDRLYRERNLRKRVKKALHEHEKKMQDSSESDSGSFDDEMICSPPDTDRRCSKDRLRSKQQSKHKKKNCHKGKPYYERRYSYKNSPHKLTEQSRHDDQDYKSRMVTNPYLEKAQEYLEQYGYGDEEENMLCDKMTPSIENKNQGGNVLANVPDDESDNVEPMRPNVCNSFLNKGACLQPGYKYLHFRLDAAYPS